MRVTQCTPLTAVRVKYRYIVAVMVETQRRAKRRGRGREKMRGGEVETLAVGGGRGDTEVITRGEDLWAVMEMGAMGEGRMGKQRHIQHYLVWQMYLCQSQMSHVSDPS